MGLSSPIGAQGRKMPVMDRSRELHPRENIPKKGWMGQTLQSTSYKEVQHSHNHTLTLPWPETTTTTFVEPHLFQMLIFLIKKIYSDQCRRNKRSEHNLKVSEEFQTCYSTLFALCVISSLSFIDLWQTKS